MPQLKYTTTIEGAKLPTHALLGDAGIDLTALVFVKEVAPNTYMYDTGICVEPPEGYYVEIVPRSSIVKSGFMLSNSVGVIDRAYIGSLKIVLTDTSGSEYAPVLNVPFTLCQLILRPYILIEPIEVEQLNETVRGDGGFGSTNK